MHGNLNDLYFYIIKVKLIIIYIKHFLTSLDKLLLFVFEFSLHSSFISKPFSVLLWHLTIDFMVIKCKIVERMFSKQTYLSNDFKIPGADFFLSSK